MSFSSNKSRRSNSSSQKMDLTETARDKKRFHTTADPSKALVEAQPCERRQRPCQHVRVLTNL